VGLNRFEPSRFYLLGGNLNGFGPGDVKVVGDVLATAPGKTPGLVRFLNASYFPINVHFLGGLKAEVFAHDGRPLRNTAVTPSPPVSAPTDLLSFGAAERYDMRLRPPAGASVGSTFSIRVDWLDWITRRVVGTRSARVRII
jgi:FtsP/CotA-like multicopper oxidase with cupredoxin domain